MSCALDVNSFRVKKYSSMNAVVVVLIILLVIFLCMFGALAFFYIHIRRSPKKAGGLKQLRGESYIPAGNVGTTYGSYNQSERRSPVVSDGDSDEDYEDDDYRPRKKKQQQRTYSSSEEESEEEYRPKRKSKKASV